MTNTIIMIHNAETGDIIEREMNADELAQFAIDEREKELSKQAEAKKAADKAALLAKLGITADEAKLLLS